MQLEKNEQFMNEFATPFADAVFNYAMQLTNRNLADAEDLSQRALVRAFVKMDQFRPGSNHRAWLFTITRNLFINDYRKAKSRPAISELDPGRVGGEDDAYAANFADLTSTPDMDLGFGDEVVDALGQVTDMHREIIMLLARGLQYEDIAKALNVELNTVRTRIYRARKVLMPLLGDYAQECGFFARENAKSSKTSSDSVATQQVLEPDLM